MKVKLKVRPLRTILQKKVQELEVRVSELKEKDKEYWKKEYIKIPWLPLYYYTCPNGTKGWESELYPSWYWESCSLVTYKKKLKELETYIKLHGDDPLEMDVSEYLKYFEEKDDEH